MYSDLSMEYGEETEKPVRIDTTDKKSDEIVIKIIRDSSSESARKSLVFSQKTSEKESKTHG